MDSVLELGLAQEIEFQLNIRIAMCYLVHCIP